MNAWIMPMVLQIMAVFTIIAEVFIPSMGLLSVIALGLTGIPFILCSARFPSLSFTRSSGGPDPSSRGVRCRA